MAREREKMRKQQIKKLKWQQTLFLNIKRSFTLYLFAFLAFFFPSLIMCAIYTKKAQTLCCLFFFFFFFFFNVSLVCRFEWHSNGTA